MTTEARNAFATIDGLRLHYRAWGDAALPALVLLHGTGGTPYIWDEFAEAMCDRFHVLAPTERGHGDSDLSSDYSAERLADDVIELTATLGIRRFSLVGGATFVWQLAARHADYVERFVFVDGAPVYDAEAMPAIRAIGELIAKVATADFGSIAEVVAFMRASQFYKLTRPEILERRVRHNVRQREDGRFVFNFDAMGILNGLRAGARTPDDESWATFRSIKCPLLVLRGVGSTVVSHSMALRMVEAVPGAALVEVPDSEHNPCSENPEGFLAAVRPFLLAQD